MVSALIGAGEKKRVAAFENGNDPHPSLAITRNGSRENRHVAAAVVARVLQKKVIGKSRTDDLVVGPTSLLVFESGKSCVLGDGGFCVCDQQAILLREFIRRSEFTV